MATLPLADGSAGSLNGTATTNAQQKTNFVNLRTFLSDLLGTDSSNKLAARVALGVTGAIQGQSDTAFTTTGTSTAYVLTPTTAIGAYATSQRFNVTFHTASGASPTIAVSGLAAKSLKQYDGTGTKVAATVYASQISDIIYDGTDFVVLDNVAAAIQQASTTEIANQSAVTKYISPDRLTSSKQVVKAWVNFDGTLTGTITPRANYNCSSVTKVSTGVYTLNFTSALSDANFCPVGGSARLTASNVAGNRSFALDFETTSTTACKIYAWNASGVAVDQANMFIGVMGN